MGVLTSQSTSVYTSDLNVEQPKTWTMCKELLTLWSRLHTIHI